MNEEWSDKYKKSINCDNPKGFSQRAHCQGRKKNMDEQHRETGRFKPIQPKNKALLVVASPRTQVSEEENPRKMYHKHFVAAMKAVPQSQKQLHHRNEMEKYKKMMGKSFIDQVAPKKMAKFDKKIKEDAPTVNTGGGQVAGLGVGNQGEPGIKKRKRHQKGELLPFYAFVRRNTK